MITVPQCNAFRQVSLNISADIHVNVVLATKVRGANTSTTALQIHVSMAGVFPISMDSFASALTV